MRELAERSPPPPPVAARTFTPEQAATLATAIGLLEKERLSAEELAILQCSLEILGIRQPEPARAPPGKVGKLRQVVSRARSLIAGKGGPPGKGKRRGLLARLRRGGDDEPDG